MTLNAYLWLSFDFCLLNFMMGIFKCTWIGLNCTAHVCNIFLNILFEFLFTITWSNNCTRVSLNTVRQKQWCELQIGLYFVTKFYQSMLFSRKICTNMFCLICFISMMYGCCVNIIYILNASFITYFNVNLSNLGLFENLTFCWAKPWAIFKVHIHSQSILFLHELHE